MTKRPPKPLTVDEWERCKKSARVLGLSPAGHNMTRLIEEVRRLRGELMSAKHEPDDERAERDASGKDGRVGA